MQERRAARDVLAATYGLDDSERFAKDEDGNTVVVAEVVEPKPEPVDWADVQRKVIAFLRSDAATYCETADIADVVGVETRKLSQHLENMHARGEICKAYVAQRANQQRASLVLWSIDADVYK